MSSLPQRPAATASPPPTATMTAASTSRGTQGDNSGDETTCAICLGAVSQPATLPFCRHTFCLGCIRQWTQVTPQCPMCKARLDSLMYEATPSVYRVHIVDPRRDRQVRRPRSARRPQVAAAPEDVRQEKAIERRRLIYARNARVHHIGANKQSGFKETLAVCSPALFKRVPAKLDRLVPWIRRDLQALDPLVPLTASSASRSSPVTNNIEFVRQYVVAVLKQHDPQSPEAVHALSSLLQEYAEHFLLELVSFARSPFNIATYDRTIDYEGIPSLDDMLAAATATATATSQTGHGSN